jgi:hypothetical protein
MTRRIGRWETLTTHGLVTGESICGIKVHPRVGDAAPTKVVASFYNPDIWNKHTGAGFSPGRRM